MEPFADRWLAASAARGAPVCVGLDPVVERLPAAVLGVSPAAGERLFAFCRDVIDATADAAPACKPQLACFERHGAEGYAAYQRVVEHARKRGVLVIADGKRGDIGTSSEHYAAGLLDGPFAADALTVNGYLGGDGLEPFVACAARRGAGLFVLVRTSNPGGDALQGLALSDGRTVAEAVADLVAGLGEGYVGRGGYSLVGAVVGATKPEDARRLRDRMPRQLFLVPGFGAQGGTAEDVRVCFHPGGVGAVITASRSVIYAYEKSGESDWRVAVRLAAEGFRREVAEVLA